MKIDQQFSQNNQMFVRFNKGEGRLVFPFDFDGIATGGRQRCQASAHRRRHQRHAHHQPAHDHRHPSRLFARHREQPAVVGRLRPVRARLSVVLHQPDPGPGVSEYLTSRTSRHWPTARTSIDVGDTWSLQPSMTRQHGRHLLKIGGDMRLLRGHFFRNTTPAGRFSLDRNQTGGPSAATPTGGFGLASMLVGFGSGVHAERTPASASKTCTTACTSRMTGA